MMSEIFLRRWLHLLSLAVLVLPLASLARTAPTLADPPPATESQATDGLSDPGLSLVTSSTAGVRLSWRSPGYTVRIDESLEGAATQVIELPGVSQASQPGKPQLPVVTALVGVPAQADVQLVIRSQESQRLSGVYRLAPAASPAPLRESLTPGEWTTSFEPGVHLSEAVYPPQPAAVEADAWLRDQRVVRVALYPFQYQPGTGELEWLTRMEIELRFDGAESDQRWTAPVSVGGAADPFEAVLRGALINYESARAWRSASPPASPPAPDRLAAQNGEASYKIGVDADGIYRLTYADLQAAGLEVNQIDPRLLQMSSQGVDVAILVQGEQDGSFDPGDYVLFYGEAFRGDRLAGRYVQEANNWLDYVTQLPDGSYVNWEPQFNAEMMEKYTAENIYWLSVGGQPGLRMTSVDGQPGGAAVKPQAFQEVLHIERDEIWRTTHFTSEETWFWEWILTGSSTTNRTYTMTVPSPAPGAGTATLRLDLVGFANDPVDSPDHHVQANLNGSATPVLDISWDGKSRNTVEASINASSLLDGVNSLKLTALRPPGIALINLLFNWIELEYPREFVAQDGELAFTSQEQGLRGYEINGFTSPQVAVFDITHPLTPTQVLSPSIQAGAGVYTTTFEIDHLPGARFVVSEAGKFRSPTRLSAYTPHDLTGSQNGADYIFITHRDFLTGTQALADYRRGQGMRVRVIDIEELYNQFNEGIFHPQAIKRFLSYAYANWQPPAPAYVLLIGDGHWNFLGGGAATYGAPGPIFIPPNLAWVDPWQGETDSTNQLATIVGTDSLADLFIGRMPVNSTAELQTVIDKIITYENMGQAAWQKRLFFITDDTPDDAGDFVAMTGNMVDHYVLPNYQADELYLDDYKDPGNCTAQAPTRLCLEANQAITTTLNITGSLITNFTGHASVNRWTHEKILVIQDIPSLTNADRLPFVMSMTCLDGYWIHGRQQTADREGPSLIEELLRAEGGGIIGAFSPTGLGVATGHEFLHEGFYTAIITDGVTTVAPAAMQAKLRLFTRGLSQDLINTFLIFGDPALRLPTVFSPAALPAGSGKPGEVVSYTVQVTNYGPVADTLTFATAGSWLATTHPLQKTLQPGESTPVQVFVNVSPTALPGQVERTDLIVSWASNLNKQASLAIATSTETGYGVSVTPQIARGLGKPGETITYTLQLSNLGNVQDSFTITATPAAWPVSLPGAVGPLNPFQVVNLQAVVQIPVTAQHGDEVTQLIEFTSQADPAETWQVQLITRAVTAFDVYLPLISRR
jgi:hypothetical protein